MPPPQPTQQQAPRPRHRRGVQVKADELRKFREELGISVRALAEQVDLAPQTLWNLESGHGPRTSPEAAHRLAHALNVKYEEIAEAAA